MVVVKIVLRQLRHERSIWNPLLGVGYVTDPMDFGFGGLSVAPVSRDQFYSLVKSESVWVPRDRRYDSSH